MCSLLILAISLSFFPFFSCPHDFRGASPSAVWRTDLAHAGRDCWGQVVSGLLLLTPPVLTDTI